MLAAASPSSISPARIIIIIIVNPHTLTVLKISETDYGTCHFLLCDICRILFDFFLQPSQELTSIVLAVTAVLFVFGDVAG